MLIGRPLRETLSEIAADQGAVGGRKKLSLFETKGGGGLETRAGLPVSGSKDLTFCQGAEQEYSKDYQKKKKQYNVGNKKRGERKLRPE